MSMSTHVVGFRPADEKWQRMKAVWDACDAAGVELPAEVDRFFDGMMPDPTGVEIDEEALVECGAVREWSDDHRAGFEVDASKLPPDLTIVRFYNSW